MVRVRDQAPHMLGGADAPPNMLRLWKFAVALEAQTRIR
jgi:hypothetical protein